MTPTASTTSSLNGTATRSRDPIPPTTSSVAVSHSSSLSGGAIVGIVIAAIVMLAGLILSLWFILRRKQHTQHKPQGLQNELEGYHGEKYAHRAELPVQLPELPCFT